MRDNEQHLRTRAFAVHLLTASGAIWALLALVAAAEQRWVMVFVWLGLALFVDGIDGPIARRLQVGKVLPNWSGETLDSIIDYSTYVLIPAFALQQSHLLGGSLSGIASALIVFSAAIYYADRRMKTVDNYFRGFPVTWNMVVFSFFVVRPDALIALVFVVFTTIVTFLPVKFLHPVRVRRLQVWNLAVFIAWGAFGLIALLHDLLPPAWVQVGLLATSVYLYTFGPVTHLIEVLLARRSRVERHG